MDRRERLNLIIRLLQEQPRSSLDIKTRFARVSARTIERDIEQLALEGRIQPVSRERSRNPVWQTSESIPSIEVKWMSGRAAAAIKFMQGCVSTLLPPSFISDLQPLFLKAEHALRQAHNREYAQALHGDGDDSGRAPLPPEVISHLVTLKQAIHGQRRISLRYRPADTSAETRLEGATPLGLLMDDRGINLLASHPSSATPLTISLPAIRGVEMEAGASTPSPGLNLGEMA